MKTLILYLSIFLSVVFFSAESYSQYIPIDSVRKQDANGVPLLLGQSVTVRGVVTMSLELGTPLVYFQDPTGGMIGYDNTFWTNTDDGDSVQCTGVVTQYNGLTELTPVTASTVLASNISYSPMVVTCNNIRVGGEAYEGRLIRINNITKVTTTTGAYQQVHTWATTGSGTNYRVISGNDSCDIRIYSSTNIANSPIPDTFSVVALNSQFDSSPPYNSGYQIIPRSLTDIIPLTSGPLLSQITYSGILTNSVTINWTSSSACDSKVRWMASDSNYQNVVYSDSLYNAAQVTNHSVVLSNLQPNRIYVYNVSSSSGTGTTTSLKQYFCTQSTSSGAMNVYFNHSVDTSLNTGEIANGNYNFLTKLLEHVNNAQYSIDMALYSLDNLTQLRDALIAAYARGVKIRFVYDSRTNQSLVNEIIGAGIPIIKRPTTSALMHNKFFVFDYRNNSNANIAWVWTGSTNITNQQFYDDVNNVIEIQDRTLAAVYTREFEEMWGSATNVPDPVRSKFGPAKTDNVPHVLNVNGTRIETYFTPGDNSTNQIQNMITTYTDYDIFFSIYAFTDINIANRMHSKFNAGKNVRGVFDRDTASGMMTEMHGHGQYAWAPAADVWIDFAETPSGDLYHHKYMLIDPLNANSNPIVETGSYNYSQAANNSNDENLVMVFSPRIANLYVQEWYKRYKASGGVAVIGVEQISSIVPAAFELRQNYPNPFNPQSVIEYKIAHNSKVMLKIYDIAGREIQTLVNEQQAPGTYKVQFKAFNLASGVYFYSLFADDNKIDSKKMILVK